MSPNIRGVVFLIVYYIVFSGIIALTTRLTNLPREISRKSYHIMSSLSIFVLIYAFDNWYSALMGVATLLCLAYLVVALFGRLAKFERVGIWRKAGVEEVLMQLAYFSIAIGILIVVFWGIFGITRRYHIAIGLVAWGFGDTAAALVGKRYGKKKYTSMLFDSHKTVEGTLAMILASFVVVFICISVLFEVCVIENIISSIVLAVVSGLAEAVSRRGLDTVVVPFAVTALSPAVMSLASLIVR